MASNSSLCGHPLKTRPGKTCMNRASHYIEGGRSCGKHINFLVGKEAPPAAPPAAPPVPPVAAPAFIPFDCGICLDECKSANDSCTTKCNHKFHKTCLLKWEQSGRRVYNCPMCRKKLPRTVKRHTASTSIDDREELELIMSTLRSYGHREAIAAVNHLENLINQAGVDAVARATARMVTELSNRIQSERASIGGG